MIYLVGVNHGYQSRVGVPNNLLREFIDFIKSKINELKIELLAEEWNDDADKLFKIDKTTIEEIGEQYKIPVMQIEESNKSKKQRGVLTVDNIRERLKQIPLKTYEDLTKREKLHKKLSDANFIDREKYWLTCLKPHSASKALFICGNNHIETFSYLLRKENITTVTLNKNQWDIGR